MVCVCARIANKLDRHFFLNNFFLLCNGILNNENISQQENWNTVWISYAKCYDVYLKNVSVFHLFLLRRDGRIHWKWTGCALKCAVLLPVDAATAAVPANFPSYWFSTFSCVHKIWIIRYINHNKANHFQCVCITELKTKSIRST